MKSRKVFFNKNGSLTSAGIPMPLYELLEAELALSDPQVSAYRWMRDELEKDINANSELAFRLSLRKIAKPHLIE